MLLPTATLLSYEYDRTTLSTRYLQRIQARTAQVMRHAHPPTSPVEAGSSGMAAFRGASSVIACDCPLGQRVCCGDWSSRTQHVTRSRVRNESLRHGHAIVMMDRRQLGKHGFERLSPRLRRRVHANQFGRSDEGVSTMPAAWRGRTLCSASAFGELAGTRIKSWSAS